MQGCQENDRSIRGDAPTGSCDVMIITVAFGSQEGWTLEQFDADATHLQSEGLDRVFLLRLPDPPSPSKRSGEVNLAKGLCRLVLDGKVVCLVHTHVDDMIARTTM